MAEARAPTVPARVDDQGQTPNCTLHAVAKAATEACDSLGIDVDQDKITEELKRKHEKGPCQGPCQAQGGGPCQGHGVWPADLHKTSLEVHELKTSRKYHMTLGVKKSTLGELQTSCGARKEYPDVLTISSSGPASSHQDDSMGEYRRMNGVEACNRPVWKREGGDKYFFYTKDNNWMVGRDYSKAAGGIKTAEPSLAKIPASGWKYFHLYSWPVSKWTDDMWANDPQLTVEGNGPPATKFVVEWTTGQSDQSGLHNIHCVYAKEWLPAQGKVSCLNSWGITNHPKPLIDPGDIRVINGDRQVFTVDVVLQARRDGDLVAVSAFPDLSRELRSGHQPPCLRTEKFSSKVFSTLTELGVQYSGKAASESWPGLAWQQLLLLAGDVETHPRPVSSQSLSDGLALQQNVNEWKEKKHIKTNSGIDRANLEEYLKTLEPNFRFLPNDLANKFTSELGKLASECDRSGSTSTIYGDLDEKTGLYGLFHCIEDERGRLTISYAITTLSAEFAQPTAPGLQVIQGVQDPLSLDKNWATSRLARTAIMELQDMCINVPDILIEKVAAEKVAAEKVAAEKAAAEKVAAENVAAEKAAAKKVSAEKAAAQKAAEKAAAEKVAAQKAAAQKAAADLRLQVTRQVMDGFARMQISKKELDTANAAMQSVMRLDTWKENTIKDITYGVREENLEKYAGILVRKLGITKPGQIDKIKAFFEGLQLSKHGLQKDDDVDLEVDEYKSVYGFLVGVRDANGWFCVGYALHSLEFKLSKKEKITFWCKPLGLGEKRKEVTVKFTVDQIAAIKRTYGRYSVLTNLVRDGDIKKINYID